MMRFRRRKEPKKFDERCRQRGKAWLASHPGYDRPHDYWSEFEPELRDVFGGFCAYCVMFVFKAQTDHFIPVAVLKQESKDELAYEWKTSATAKEFSMGGRAGTSFLTHFRCKTSGLR